jgi:(1->4)-alpha-D-glucan 1-alpha-D-glucosylmutase
MRLVGEGLIDGLRVDHVDGLADPRGYLRRLAEAAGVWIVAEKILAAWEGLPEDWACAGTTGYDALALVDGVFLDPDGEEPLSSEYARFTGNKAAFAAVARDAKREVARASFAAEMSQLARLLAAPDADAREVLAELAACLRVYRAYVVAGQTPPQPAVMAVGDALAAAKSALPARLHGLADAACDAALGTGPAEFAVRFGQFTAPVQAKGVEDTACYRWSRLVAANEVGSDPGRFGVGVAAFHAEASRLAHHWPATMTTLSTHDTKRAEDVRARLAVLAERPGEWAEAVTAWHLLMPEHVLDPDTEYLLWQTLVGAWPVDEDRLREYLTKAMREAKTRTSWTDPDPAYESAALEFAARARHVAPVGDFVSSIEPDARANSLGAKLVQLTMPGVPDVYQGCELESLALVDPDNRRPVDFGRRQELLDTGELPDKLVVTTRALRLRRDNPGWFAAGSYTPLRAEGPAAGHVIAFARGGNAVTIATRLPAGLRRRGGWAGTALALPAAPGRPAAGWTDVLTGAEHKEPRPTLAALTRRLPVALLTPR